MKTARPVTVNAPSAPARRSLRVRSHLRAGASAPAPATNDAAAARTFDMDYPGHYAS